MPRPDRLPTTYHDCHAALDQFVVGHSGRTSYVFGRGNQVTYKVPKTFASGTCALTLDMVYDDQSARLTISEVAKAASNLMVRCTTGILFQYGGIIAVGPSDVLYVTIMGVEVSSTS